MPKNLTLQQRAVMSAGHRKMNGEHIQRGTPEWYLAVQSYIQRQSNPEPSTKTHKISRQLEHNAAIYASHKAPGILKHTNIWQQFFRHYIIGVLLEDLARRRMHGIDDISIFWCDECQKYYPETQHHTRIVAEMTLHYSVCPVCNKETAPALKEKEGNEFSL